MKKFRIEINLADVENNNSRVISLEVTSRFSGGDAGHSNGNGEGGYSYAVQKLTDVYFKPAAHSGPGEVFVIPAISGCGCDYRCVALDQYLSETKCLCPQGWLLSNDSKSCISKHNHDVPLTSLLHANEKEIKSR